MKQPSNLRNTDAICLTEKQTRAPELEPRKSRVMALSMGVNETPYGLARSSLPRSSTVRFVRLENCPKSSSLDLQSVTKERDANRKRLRPGS